jgi:organic radical activating enzyme
MSLTNQSPYIVQDGLIYIRKVEVQVAFNCNLTCKGCVHGSPSRPANLLSPEEFEKDLHALRSVARVHKLALLGGEPLLHQGIVQLLQIARASGIAQHICVITNGVGLESMPDEFFRNVDIIEVSHYPRVRLRFTEGELAHKAEKFGFRYKIHRHNQFMLTHLNAPIDNADLVEQIYKRCKSRGEWSCHTFADGHYYMCSRSAILRERLLVAGEDVDNRAVDSVQLHDNPDLFSDLVAYLQRDIPLEACKWCLGSDGVAYSHSLQSKKAALREATQVIQFQPSHLGARARSELANLLGERDGSANAGDSFGQK